MDGRRVRGGKKHEGMMEGMNEDDRWARGWWQSPRCESSNREAERAKNKTRWASGDGGRGVGLQTRRETIHGTRGSKSLRLHTAHCPRKPLENPTVRRPGFKVHYR
ncbi:hypothetical protein SKAU_G00381850 [Synaphobranchus kaupii]|uniref:Uncharacterized protein n=1 Tax=Synaphobranchus kaupii TaxID=118154 RepID=A0A9Q1EDT3_SYNKA|nr:hypothetical protein SKAU_G00381850 [Synaphobranchus kaupii]